MSDERLEVKPEDSVAPWRGATGQEAHTAEELAPEVDEKVPEGHVAVHVWEVRPGVAPQVPAGQGVQVADVALPVE
jgi:hypothetical protein